MGLRRHRRQLTNARSAVEGPRVRASERLAMDARRGMTARASGILDREQSAALRERLLAEVGNIASADLAASWAREALAAKNSLTATDAKLVEDAFERRLSELASSDAVGPANDDAPAGSDCRDPRRPLRKALTLVKRRHRQERARGRRATSLSQPGAPSLRRTAAVSRLRPQAIGPASPTLHAAARARPQGQR